jgi:hypothetical protein
MEYYIPKQTVQRCSVDYDENIGELRLKDGWNVVVHSHPFNTTGNGSFSVSDEETINSHFDCSLLYVPHAIADSRLLIDIQGNKLQLTVPKDKILIWKTVCPDVQGLEKIVEKSWGSNSTSGYAYGDSGALWNHGGKYVPAKTEAKTKKECRIGSDKAGGQYTRWFRGRWYTPEEFKIVEKQDAKTDMYLFRGSYYTEEEWQKVTRDYLNGQGDFSGI